MKLDRGKPVLCQLGFETYFVNITVPNKKQKKYCCIYPDVRIFKFWFLINQLFGGSKPKLVDPSAPTILWSQVQIPSTTCTLYSMYVGNVNVKVATGK